MKSMPVPWRQTLGNGRIILCMFILFTSDDDQMILYAQTNQFIYINLLQEEPEMQEFQFNIDGTHEGDCKNLRKHSQKIRETHDQFIL